MQPWDKWVKDHVSGSTCWNYSNSSLKTAGSADRMQNHRLKHKVIVLDLVFTVQVQKTIYKL